MIYPQALLSSPSPQHHFLAELSWSSCPGLLSSEGLMHCTEPPAGCTLHLAAHLLSSPQPHSTWVTKLQRHLDCRGTEKCALEHFFPLIQYSGHYSLGSELLLLVPLKSKGKLPIASPKIFSNSVCRFRGKQKQQKCFGTSVEVIQLCQLYLLSCSENRIAYLADDCSLRCSCLT